MSDELMGKWALVTGAGSGIGRETAIQLAAAGVNLVLADIAFNEDDAAQRVVPAPTAQVRAIKLDVADFSAVRETVGKVSQEVGGFDYLVHAAGIPGRGPVESLDDMSIAKVFSINTFGFMYLCIAALPDMIRNGRGSIVSISSHIAQNGQANFSNYAASKGALISFTKALAREKAAAGIRANCVAPGPIDTPLWRQGVVLQNRDVDSAIAERSQRIPLGRLGSPSDVAGVIVFLLGPAAAHITGQTIPVNGGEVMR